MPQWIFVAISMVVPVFLVRQQRSPQVFKSSDLLLAFLIFASYGFIDAFFNELEIKAIHLIETGLTLLVWIPIVRRFPEIATSIITLLGKLLKKLLGFVRPEIANYPKSIAIGISTIIAALLIYGQSPYYDNFLTILMSLGLIILSIIAFSKYGEESVRSFVRSNIFAKQNRNSVAIAIGATAIVLAVIANGTGNNPSSSSDSPSPINSESVPPQQRQILPSRANGGCPTGTTGISSSYCKAYGDTQYIPTDQYGGCPTGATGAGAGYCRLYR